MKSQRRHQLESNKLADWINRSIEQYTPYLRLVGISVLGVFAIFAAFSFYRSSQSAKEGAAWREFYQAFAERSPEDLASVAKDNEGTSVALWAKQAAADSLLARGITALFTNRDDAQKYLKDAAKNLEEIESSSVADQTLKQRARFALAQTYESLSDLEPAKKYYDAVAQASPESALGKVAADRTKRLSDPETIRWYEWFSRQKPTAPQPIGQGPGSGSIFGPGGSGVLGDLPKTSDLPSLEKQLSTPVLNGPKLPLPPSSTTTPTPDSPALPAPDLPEKKTESENASPETTKSETKPNSGEQKTNSEEKKSSETEAKKSEPEKSN